jgi:hypothetical protein
LGTSWIFPSWFLLTSFYVSSDDPERWTW